jgi:hypothetical protein
MFITLTNAKVDLKGEPVILNTESIVSITRGTRVAEDKTVEEVTYVYMPPHGTWEIEETLDEILKIINKE